MPKIKYLVSLGLPFKKERLDLENIYNLAIIFLNIIVKNDIHCHRVIVENEAFVRP